MVLVSTKPIMASANEHNYAFGAFNVNAVDQVEPLIKVHEVLRSPLIIQVADLAMGFIGGRGNFIESTLEDKIKGAKIIGDCVKKYGEQASIPIVLHLDHGQNLDSVKAAIDGGFTSVMFDGSSLPYEENVEKTREVVEYAHARGVSVEGELGIIAGVEDNIYAETSTYTNPTQALDFIKRTNVELLAISYGTLHGPNKGKNVKLRNEIVIALKELLSFEDLHCDIVSHGSSTVPQHIIRDLLEYGVDISGASGISHEEMDKAIAAGVRKINIDTDIRMATTRNLYQIFKDHGEMKELEKNKALYEQLANNDTNNIDPRVFWTPYMHEVANGFSDEEYKLVKQAIQDGVTEISAQISTRFGSVGQANTIKI